MMDAKGIISGFTEFFENNYMQQMIDSKRYDKGFFEVAFDDLSKWNLDLANELLENPEETIKAAELAAESFDIGDIKELPGMFMNPEEAIKAAELASKKTVLSVWFTNLPQTQQRNIWEVRKEDIGEMIGLKGIINKASSIVHVCISAKFECPTCGSVINVLQIDHSFKEPSKCSCGRKGKMILLDKEIKDTIKLGLIDDLMDKANVDRSIAREKLSILAGDNLTSHEIDNKIKPGKKVILNGYFKYMQKMNSTEFDSIFQVNSIEFVQVGWDTVKVSSSEENKIKEFAKENDIIARLSESIADVEGFPEVKTACLLLLAGAPHMYDKNGHLTSRGTIHVLLVSDPGAGKTFLIKRAGAISPIFSFQSAATASGKGLVASVAQDKEIASWVIYPGVVAMASKGVVGLDEIDKTHKDDYGDHNNAMNDMLVPVARANVKAKLETETSYLATANPVNRIFTSYDSYINQIDMPKDFLDRFDIILPMVPPKDAAVRDRIMDIMLERHIEESQQKIWIPEFTHEFIRKYIACCRRINPKPKLSRELFAVIKKRLTELMQPRDEEQIRVSFRQLESIMRFAYASARLRLRDIIEEDIDLAFSLKFKSFTDLGIISSSGEFSWAKLENVNEEKISDDKTIHDVLKEFLPDTERLAETQNIVNICVAKGIDEDKVEEYIEKKKMIGDLIEPRRGFIRRL